jgi:hypothetical protein
LKQQLQYLLFLLRLLLLHHVQLQQQLDHVHQLWVLHALVLPLLVLVLLLLVLLLLVLVLLVPVLHLDLVVPLGHDQAVKHHLDQGELPCHGQVVKRHLDLQVRVSFQELWHQEFVLDLEHHLVHHVPQVVHVRQPWEVQHEALVLLGPLLVTFRLEVFLPGQVVLRHHDLQVVHVRQLWEVQHEALVLLEPLLVVNQVLQRELVLVHHEHFHLL